MSEHEEFKSHNTVVYYIISCPPELLLNDKMLFYDVI